METTFKFRIDLDELNSIKSYATSNSMSAASVFKDGARLVLGGGGGVVVSEVVVSPAPSVESGGVKSVLADLKSKFGGHVVSASELDESGKIVDKPRELPFGDTPKSLSRLMSPQHQALLDRFVGILRSSTPDGVKAISSQLMQWEELMEF